jgi:integrase
MESKLEVNRSGFWEIRWTDVDGESRQRSRTYSCRTRDRAVAEGVKLAWEAAQRAVAPAIAAGSKTVDDVLAAYLAGHVGANGRTGAQQNNLRVVRRELGGVLVANLSESRVDWFRAKRLASGRASGTVRRELGALRAALTWAERKRLVPAGLDIRFDLPPDGAPRSRYLSEIEEAALWDAAAALVSGPLPAPQRRIGLFVCLALETAARAGAIRGLTWDRVDFARGMIDYRDPALAATKKRRVPVPMSDRLKPVLELAHSRSSGWGCVLGHSGSVRGPYERLRVREGLPDVNIHDLRRTWATLRVSWGVPMGEVAAILGDSVDVVERHYAMFAPGYLRSAVNMRGRGLGA